VTNLKSAILSNTRYDEVEDTSLADFFRANLLDLLTSGRVFSTDGDWHTAPRMVHPPVGA
jgi:hypothetical protein